MSFHILQATTGDVDVLAALFDGYRQFYGQPSDLPRAVDFLIARIEQDESLILLARDPSGVGLGFTQLYPLFSSVHTARTWLLNDLFVAPLARRQGVAAALLRAATEQARQRGAASLSLSTARDNAPARALYDSLGWRRDQEFCEYGLVL